MNIQEVVIKIDDAFTSDYCSLFDDGVNCGKLRFDKNQVEDALKELKALSSKIGVLTYAYIWPFETIDFEFDKETQYHRVDTVLLSSAGLITVETSSKYDSQDFFQFTVGI